MWSFEHSIETNATPKRIWALYSDVGKWPLWDAGISSITIDGPFSAGSTGTITPAGQDSLPYRLLAVDPEKGFSDQTELPGHEAVIRFIHSIDVLQSGKTRITHRVEIDGNDADEVGSRIGSAFAKGVPETMCSLANMALHGADDRPQEPEE
ncbi:MAG: SRPBCC family protein [Thermoplasmataceae archaeon]